MTDIRSVLAENMKSRRKILNLSQADLAEKIGTAPNYISKIESKKQFPSVQMIENIAHALKVDTVDLFSLRLKKTKDLDAAQEDLLKKMNALVKSAFSKIEL
ncbi:MAG: helix-turn-helix transcriptional regulator [Treponema sp.]|nr:helix-turn-helix transcriptional regulator [Treponema sp.]